MVAVALLWCAGDFHCTLPAHMTELLRGIWGWSPCCCVFAGWRVVQPCRGDGSACQLACVYGMLCEPCRAQAQGAWQRFLYMLHLYCRQSPGL